MHLTVLNPIFVISASSLDVFLLLSANDLTLLNQTNIFSLTNVLIDMGV